MYEITVIAMSLGAILGIMLSVIQDKYYLYRYRNYEPKVEMINGISTIDVGKLPCVVADKIVREYRVN